MHNSIFSFLSAGSTSTISTTSTRAGSTSTIFTTSTRAGSTSTISTTSTRAGSTSTASVSVELGSISTESTLPTVWSTSSQTVSLTPFATSTVSTTLSSGKIPLFHCLYLSFMHYRWNNIYYNNFHSSCHCCHFNNWYLSIIIMYLWKAVNI